LAYATDALNWEKRIGATGYGLTITVGCWLESGWGRAVMLNPGLVLVFWAVVREGD
jgi:hypothetical protein